MNLIIIFFTLLISKLSIQHPLPEIVLVDVNNNNTLYLLEMIKAIAVNNEDGINKIPINILTISNKSYEIAKDIRKNEIIQTDNKWQLINSIDSRPETTTLSLITFDDQIKSATQGYLELITSIQPLETTTLELVTLEPLKMLKTTTLELKFNGFINEN